MLKICPQSLSHPVFTNDWKFWMADLQTCYGSSDLIVFSCMVLHAVSVMLLPFYEGTSWFQVGLQRGPHLLEKQWGLPGQTKMLPYSLHPQATPLLCFPFSFSLSCCLVLPTQLGWAGHQSMCGNNCMFIYVFMYVLKKQSCPIDAFRACLFIMYVCKIMYFKQTV